MIHGVQCICLLRIYQKKKNKTQLSTSTQRIIRQPRGKNLSAYLKSAISIPLCMVSNLSYFNTCFRSKETPKRRQLSLSLCLSKHLSLIKLLTHSLCLNKALSLSHVSASISLLASSSVSDYVSASFSLTIYVSTRLSISSYVSTRLSITTTTTS